MNAIGEAYRRIGRFLPHSLFWRFLIAAVALGLVTAFAAVLASYAVGRDLIFRFQEDAGLSVLHSAAEFAAGARREIGDARERLLSRRRETLAANCARAAGMLATLPRDDAAFSAKARSLLASIALPEGEGLILLDGENAVLWSEGGLFLGRPHAGEADRRSPEQLREIAAAARAASGAMAFAEFPGEFSGPDNHPSLLAGAMTAGAPGCVICSVIALKDLDAELERETRTIMAGLRDRLGSLVVAKTGYVYVFDESCRMLAHPTLEPEEFGSLIVPGTKTLMCEELKRISRFPWGANRLFYEWDRPGDKGDFVYPKISWCVRELSSGWYVGASVYAEEMWLSLPRMIAIVFFPALVSIVLMGGGLSLLLRALLKPVRDLAAACRRIGLGDMRAEAPEDAPGELGFLGRQFNSMVGSLRRLRRQDQRRREELEALNAGLELMVVQRTAKLERKARKLIKANARLTELDAMKSIFLSSVSHELRTPLTAIKGFARLIAKDLRKTLAVLPETSRPARDRYDRIQENLGIIESESDHLTRLINDFLDLSKIESGKAEWKDELFDVREAVLDAAAALSEALREKPDVALSLDLPPARVLVRGDRERLTQVMLNLMDNALKFTRKGGVTVCLRSRDGWLEGAVRDSGMGVRREDLLRIFDKFHQAGPVEDVLSEKPKGTGLGLAICRNILSRLHGLIYAESELGKGTVIAFEMPLDFTKQAVDEGFRTALAPEHDAPLILAMAHAPALEAPLRLLLERGGYRALLAFSLREAQEIADSTPLDGLVMDLVNALPDGRRPLAVLEDDPVFSALPTVSLRLDLSSDALEERPGEILDDQEVIAALDALFREKTPERSCLAVTDGNGPAPGQMLFNSPGNCSFCSPSGLPAILKSGFSGLVFIPSHLAGRVDVAALAALPGVTVALTPA